MSLKKLGPVFIAKTELYISDGTKIGAENRPFLNSCKRSLKKGAFISLC